MAGRYSGRSRRSGRARTGLAVIALVCVLAIFLAAAFFFERKLDKPVENAGMQVTFFDDEDAGYVLVNGRTYAGKNVETLLFVGVESSTAGAYGKAGPVVLLVRDADTGKSSALQLDENIIAYMESPGNEGMRSAQISRAFENVPDAAAGSRIAVQAVEKLLGGVGIGHCMTVSMEAVPVLNDWAGGVEVEISEDFAAGDYEFSAGEKILLENDMARAYVTAFGNDETGNDRQRRQRQYIFSWFAKAKPKFSDMTAAMDLFMKLSGYYYTDAAADELQNVLDMMGDGAEAEIYDIPGSTVKNGDLYEFCPDDGALTEIVIELFCGAEIH